MSIKHLVTAASALALMAGAAQAQTTTAHRTAETAAQDGNPANAGTNPPVPPTTPESTVAPPHVAAPGSDASAMGGATGAAGTGMDASTMSGSTMGAAGSTGMAAAGSTGAASPGMPGASADASAVVATQTVTNGPVADTPENRAKYGQPMSRAGKRTAAKGN